MMHMIGKRLVEPHPHHALGGLNRQRCVGRNLACHLARPDHQGGVWHDLVGKTPLESFPRRERATGKDQFQRLGPADHARQKPGTSRFRHHTALDEGSRQL